jgi:2-hydroxy-6-oxonona-2,4-dienedioate hydrolase
MFIPPIIKEALAGWHPSRSTRCWNVAALAALLFFMPVGGQAQEVAKDGSIAGLHAKFVDVNGVRTRYYEAGQGEPLVLVHGEGWSGHSSANTWSKNIPGLAKRFHVFAPDKLASGMTGNPLDDKDYNIQGEVEHIVQFIHTMKLGKIHLVGQSRGGGCVFFLAVAHPEIVRTLVIIDTLTASPEGPNTRQETLAKCPKEPDWVEWKCRLQSISFKPEVAFDDEFWEAGKYMASLPKSQETVAKIKAGAGEPLASQFNAWKKTVHERVKNEGLLQMPVLLYWGRNDPSAVLARGLDLFEIIAEKNPRTRMLIANKAGHFHYREYPEEFNQNIINFIDYWERQPAATPAKPS